MASGPTDGDGGLGGGTDGPAGRAVGDLRTGLGALRESYTLLIVVGLLVGLLVAPSAASLVDRSGEERPQVAVIRLAGGINGATAQAVVDRVRTARSDPAVEAIVLRVNSPGGGAAASEQLYLELARAAAEMPVVTSVDAQAASGAYYAAVATDYIFVKPASLVGSVGVIFTAPEDLPPLEQVIVTGSEKLSGGDRQDWYYRLDAAKRAFVGAVVTQRADRLSISREAIASANIYSGPRTVENGMTDAVGGLQAAIERAASQAGVTDYSVTRLSLDGATFVTRSSYTASPLADKRLVGPEYFVGNGTGAAAPNVLMLSPSVAAQGLEGQVVTAGAVRERAGNTTATNTTARTAGAGLPATVAAPTGGDGGA